jgi:K+-transporting ATPase ATPase C chain
MSEGDSMNAKILLDQLRTSAAATMVLAFILCGIYPLAVWGVSQLMFPRQANGSLSIVNGRIVGSSLIAQNFKGERYFHPRPSAAGSYGYDAANSGGSNLGPLSRELIDQVRDRVKAYRSENSLEGDTPVPVDAVTASGSGLDPHISVVNAQIQAARVARARGMTEEEVNVLVHQYTEGPQLGFLGDSRINVLKLNIALDALSGRPHVIQ